MIFGTLSFRGCGGQSLALVWNRRVKSQMPEHAFEEKSTKLLILLPIRTIYNLTFQCETPCRNKGWLNDGKHGQGTHWTKKGADSLAENNPNAPKFICPICLPKPKNSGFQWKKASLGVLSPCYWKSESKTVYYKTRMLPNRGLGTIASFIFYSYK